MSTSLGYLCSPCSFSMHSPLSSILHFLTFILEWNWSPCCASYTSPASSWVSLSLPVPPCWLSWGLLSQHAHVLFMGFLQLTVLFPLLQISFMDQRLLIYIFIPELYFMKHNYPTLLLSKKSYLAPCFMSWQVLEINGYWKEPCIQSWHPVPSFHGKYMGKQWKQ